MPRYIKCLDIAQVSSIASAVLGHANEPGISANTRFEVCIAQDNPEPDFDLAAFFACLFTTWATWATRRRVDGRRADGRRPPRRQFEPGRPPLISPPGPAPIPHNALFPF